MLVDRFGRSHDDLRVSVTDRCNLRCAYCMPEEPVWYPRERILRFEEVERVVRIAASLGVRKVRVTGGEPLVRRDVARLVAALAAIPGIEDLSLTSNGVLLARHARSLAEAGLDRVNVSLDTLDGKRFAALTGRDALPAVLEGLDAAAAAGLRPIKLNTVLLRGINDDEATSLVAFARERRFEIRFIEFMPLENGGSWDPSRVVRGAAVREAVHALWPIAPAPRQDPNAPATRWLFEDGSGSLGFIDSVSSPFCGACARIRLTADGKLRVCLYDDRETDLKELLRSGATDEEIAGRFAIALSGKGRGGAVDLLERGGGPALLRTMHQIGG